MIFPSTSLSSKLLQRPDPSPKAMVPACRQVGSDILRIPFRLEQIKNTQRGGVFNLLVPRQGFEPRFLGPKPSVLPLDDLGMDSRASIT